MATVGSLYDDLRTLIANLHEANMPEIARRLEDAMCGVTSGEIFALAGRCLDDMKKDTALPSRLIDQARNILSSIDNIIGKA